MEKIDLSTNSRAIQDAYDKVVRGDASATYVVYTVDHGTLDVTEVNNGSLDEFVENFTDGQVQFGLARVTVPGSDVSKNLLLGWCPDNSPAKSRLSFATNFAEVSKVLSGYHVQITARDQDDLDVDEFLNKVSAAAGARYSIQSGKVSAAPTSKPAVAKPIVSKPAVSKPAVSKPASKPSSFVPKTTGKPIVPVAAKPASIKRDDDDEEWGGEKEIQERDFEKNPLENVPSAYKPTKVNMAELRKEKSSTISSQPKPNNLNNKQEDKSVSEEPKSIGERIGAYSDDGRITSLPKPKVSNSVASRFTPNKETSNSGAPAFGAKPNFGTPSINKKDKLVGGASRNFGSEGGKTPAQIWAEKRGQYKVVSQVEDEVNNVTEDLGKQTLDDEPEQLVKPSSGGFSPVPEQKSIPGTLPSRNLPPPPVRTLPKEEEEEEEEEEEKEEEEEVAQNEVKEEEEEEEEDTRVEAPAPSLPVRNLPPPPVRNVEPEEKNEAPAPSLPIRNLPPPPVRNVEAAAPVPVPEPEEEPVNATSNGSKKSVTAVAEYDYEKDEDNEIGFSEGDLIVEIEFADEEWWSGKHEKTGEVGLFPAAYVVLKEEQDSNPTAAVTTSAPAPATSTEQASKGPSAIAEYDYERDEDNEIEFAEGDEIVDIEFVDEDWWSGKHTKSGEVGLFPANYVKLNE